MKKLILFSLMSLAGTSVFALPDYDPFADATGSGGTSYTVGASLIGQTNAGGQSWSLAGTGTGAPTIASGSLTIPGLATSGGNSAAFGGNGSSARFNIGTTTSSGTIYYSLSLQLTSITSLSTSGIFFAGFNNSSGATGSNPTSVADKLYARAVTGGYNIGFSKNTTASTSGGGIIWDSTDVYTTSSVLFLVASYTYNTTSTSDDLGQLWINPSSTSYGGSAPTATLTDNSTSADFGNILSFVLCDRSTAEPNAGIVDDLRVGTTYADVTPVPEPTVIALGGLGAVCLGFMARRRFGRR